jgi:membrane protease YdiL (CAAX protease family)
MIILLLLIAGSITTWLLVWQRIATRGTALPYAPRSRVPWRGIDFLVIASFYVGTQVIAIMAALLIAGVVPNSVDTEEMLHTPGLLLALSLAFFATVVFATEWLRWVRAASAEDLGWGQRSLRADISLGLAGMLAAAAPVYMLQFVMFHLFPIRHPIIDALEGNGNTMVFGMAILVTVVAAPVVEEVVFRLVLQGWLEACEPPWRRRMPQLRRWRRGRLPIVISSTVFAAVHISAGPAPIALFFLALVLGYQYQRTHRLLPSIVTHAAFNATSIIMLALQQTGAS